MTRNDVIGVVFGAVFVGGVVYLLLQGREERDAALEAPVAVSQEVVKASDEPLGVVAEDDASEVAVEPGEPLDAAEEATATGVEETTVVDEDSASAAPEVPQEVQGDDDAQADAGAETAPVAAPAPVYDIIRIEPDGGGLVAGRAQPGETVEIVVEGDVVGEATAGADGAFVAFIEVDRDGDAVVVENANGAGPGEAGEDSVADADKAPLAEVAQSLVIRAKPGEAEPAVESAPVFVLGALDDASAPVVVQPDDEGVRLIQAPERAVSDGVTLDAISYDAAGRVIFAGRASPGGLVRLYLDGAPIGDVGVSDDGSWRTRAEEVIDAGVYTLRLDQLDASGAVISRIETPFMREAITEGPLGENVVTVQRGDNLWRIAEGFYGDGVRYTVIFGANEDQIRDPDLIYPGQIFTIPDEPNRG